MACSATPRPSGELRMAVLPCLCVPVLCCLAGAHAAAWLVRGQTPQALTALSPSSPLRPALQHHLHRLRPRQGGGPIHEAGLHPLVSRRSPLCSLFNPAAAATALLEGRSTGHMIHC
jgi:hypothetical protein